FDFSPAARGVVDQVRRSSDGGATWVTLLELGRAESFVTGIAVDAHDPRRIVVAFGEYDSQTHLPVGGGVYRSQDGGATWSLARLAGPIFTVAIDPSAPGRIYAGGTALQMYASDDFGITWSLMFQGLPFVSIADLELDPQAPGRLYAGTFGGGIYTFT